LDCSSVSYAFHQQFNTNDLKLNLSSDLEDCAILPALFYEKNKNIGNKRIYQAFPETGRESRNPVTIDTNSLALGTPGQPAANYYRRGPAGAASFFG
jgi:hypothetical protein